MSSCPVEEVEVQSSSVQEKPETYDVEDVLCETGYTTGGDSATELDTYELEEWVSIMNASYPSRKELKFYFSVWLLF